MCVMYVSVGIQRESLIRFSHSLEALQVELFLFSRTFSEGCSGVGAESQNC